MATILNRVDTYLKTLNATSAICTAFGSAFTTSNLFLGYEQMSDNDSVTLIPYSGEPMRTDVYRQTPYFQIRVKSSSKATAINTQQAFIDNLHLNSMGGTARLYSLNSAPLLLESQSGGKWAITASNYKAKMIR